MKNPNLFGWECRISRRGGRDLNEHVTIERQNALTGARVVFHDINHARPRFDATHTEARVFASQLERQHVTVKRDR